MLWANPVYLPCGFEIEGERRECGAVLRWRVLGGRADGIVWY